MFLTLESVNINDRDTCSSELHVLVAEMADVGHSGKVLADELSQDAGARSVKDSHAWHTSQDSVIDEISDGIDGFIASHTSDIEVLMEVLAA